MSNKEKCIVMLQATKEAIDKTSDDAGLKPNIDTHKKIIPIFGATFSKEIGKEKEISTEVIAYRKELEAEKTSQTSSLLGSSKKEA